MKENTQTNRIKYKAVGVTGDKENCEQCGKHIKKAVVLAFGENYDQYTYVGTECAGKMLGYSDISNRTKMNKLIIQLEAKEYNDKIAAEYALKDIPHLVFPTHQEATNCFKRRVCGASGISLEDWVKTFQASTLMYNSESRLYIRIQSHNTTRITAAEQLGYVTICYGNPSPEQLPEQLPELLPKLFSASLSSAA